MGQSITKRFKPDFHVPISARSSNRLSDLLQAFKAKTLTIPSSDDCPWQGCTLSDVPHVHLFPQDVPEFTASTSWITSEVDIDCPVLACFNCEPHIHSHTSTRRKRLDDYRNYLVQDQAMRMQVVLQQESRKLDEKRSEEVESAKQSSPEKVAWSPDDEGNGMAFELELRNIFGKQTRAS